MIVYICAVRAPPTTPSAGARPRRAVRRRHLTGEAPRRPRRSRAAAPRAGAGPLQHDELGSGPPVLLVHGVAFGPSAFAATARDLARDRRVILVHRRGYGRSPAPVAEGRPEDQAADIAGILDGLGLGRVTALGVSGGATVLTALAIAAPGRLDGVVLHEPALGPLAPGVHALIGGLARAVAAAASDAAGAEVVAAALAGPGTWGALGASGRAEARRAASTVCREVPWFARFAPTAADLAVLRGIPVIASTGERSGPERREATGVLVRLAGARTALVPHAANLAHLENPAALADLVRRLGAPTAPKEQP